MVKQDCLANGTLVTAKGRGALGDVYIVVGRMQNEKKKCPKLALRKKTDGSNGVVYGQVIMVDSHRIRRVRVSESLSADEDVSESSMVSDARSVDPAQILVDPEQILVDPEQFLREDLRRFPTPANLVREVKAGESIPEFADTPAEARVKVENMVRAVRNLGLKFSPKSPKRKKKSKTKKKRKRKSKKTKKRKKSKKKMKKIN